MSFNFGKPSGTGGSGFSFGATPATTPSTVATNTGGFAFGGNAPPGGGNPKPTAFGGFGTQPAQSTSQNTGGFNFGQQQALAQTTTPSVGGFGQQATTKPAEGGFGFGQSKPSTGFSFGTPSNQQQPPSNTAVVPAQPQQQQQQQPQTGGFSFGTPSTQQTSGAVAQQTSGFNFGAAGAKPGATMLQQPQQQPTGTTAGIFGASVGVSSAPGGGAPAVSTQQVGGFSFGGQGQTALGTLGSSAAPQPSTGGFTGFGGAPQQQKPPPSFSLATAQQQPQIVTSTVSSLPKPSALGGLLSAPTSNPPASSITTQQQPSSSVLQLGGPTPATSGQPTAGFKLTAATAAPTAPGGLALGMSTAKTTGAETSGFSFGTPKQTGGLSLGGTSQTAPLGGLNTAVSTLSSLTTTTSSTAATSGFRLGGLASTTATGGMTLGGKPLGQPTVTPTATPTATTSAPGLILGKSTATTATTSGAVLSTLTQTTASTSVPPSMNYRQLEEQINKWSLELEEQEKVFIQQATQVNAWDRLLIDNGDKIAQLNTDVERVKLDQQRLDQELDFILAQQRELEEMLVPLEQNVEQTPAIHYQQHADLEREHTYKMSENIDAQLKRMVQDLKEIIDHINASNTNQDDTDPVQQIAKVLNAHMDSLQWIDQNTVLLQRRVEDVAKRADQRKNEQERNLRLAYD